MDEQRKILKQNEEVARKLARIGEDIDSYTSGTTLFEELLPRLEEEFGITIVWLSLVDRREFLELIEELRSSENLRNRLRLIRRPEFMDLLGGGINPVLMSGHLKTYYKLLPADRKVMIRSLALVPLTIQNECFGSLNFGDFSPHRYQPGMDTDLLQYLASRVSFRLTKIFSLGSQSAGLLPLKEEENLC